MFDEAEHGAFGQLVEAPLANVFLLSSVLSEEIIEHDTDEWDEKKHEKPGHSLSRLTVVHQYSCHRTYDSGDIDDEYGPVEVDHFG